MDFFEGEYSCYKFIIAEKAVNEKYDITIYCHVDDVEFKQLIEFDGLVSLPDKISQVLVLKDYKADFRTAFKYAQSIIDKVLLGKLLKEQQ